MKVTLPVTFDYFQKHCFSLLYLSRQKRGLMTCKRSAVCGLVQANAWGINAEKFCDCPGRQPCPLLWDPEDGRSVTHGSNQYKVSSRSPTPPTSTRSVQGHPRLQPVQGQFKFTRGSNQ